MNTQLKEYLFKTLFEDIRTKEQKDKASHDEAVLEINRFPIMSNTNLREWENEFSHCCKLVLLNCRIVLHAACSLMASKHDID